MFINSEDTFNCYYENKRNCENAHLDYKREFKFSTKREKLEIVKDIVSFANTDGGIIFYGVNDNFDWSGLEDDSDDIDDIAIGDEIFKYLGNKVDFQTGIYSKEDNTFYMITIQPFLGKNPYAFIKTGEYERQKNGKAIKRTVFNKGDIYGRVGSSSRPVNNDGFFLQMRSSKFNVLTNLNEIDCPYCKYVERTKNEKELLEALNKTNIKNVQINGIGGIGKTSFVYNFCTKIVDGIIKLNFKFNSIIWITGKMNYFTDDGEINVLRETNLSFSEMLKTICDVLYIDVTNLSDSELEKTVYEKLQDYPSLFIFDNMETINDDRIIRFYENLPKESHVIFTTRSNLTNSFTRLDIEGFDSESFKSFVKNILLETRPQKAEEYWRQIEPDVEEFRKLIGGSPILMNFIVKKICSGGGVRQVLDDVRALGESEFYNNLMDFCFNDTFKRLPRTSKEILYIMSISNDEKEEFESQDLSFILKITNKVVCDGLSVLNEFSFCNEKEGKYSCSLLLRAFVSKKINIKNPYQIDIEKISKNYYSWSDKKKSFNEKNNAFFNKVKAFDFKRKMVVVRIAEIKKEYYFNDDIDEMIDKILLLEKECPDYGYIHLEIAEILKYEEDPERRKQADEYFKKAIRLDPKNDYFLSEYAFFLSAKRNFLEAIAYFKKALALKPGLSSINNGLASACLFMYQKGNGLQCPETPEAILGYFEKGYEHDDDIASLRNYARNAFRHAQFLFCLKEYDKALAVCDDGLNRFFLQQLDAFKGHILTTMYPDRTSSTKIRKNKRGLFAAVDDETMKQILENAVD